MHWVCWNGARAAIRSGQRTSQSSVDNPQLHADDGTGQEQQDHLLTVHLPVSECDNRGCAATHSARASADADPNPLPYGTPLGCS
jgi:hypothetical protein